MDLSQLSRRPRTHYVTVGTSFADYIVTGTNDHVPLLAALNAGGHIILKKNTTFNLGAALNPTIGNWVLEAEDTTAILKVNNNTNVSIFNISTQGLSNIALKGITLDQNGANQTSGGGGFVMNRFTDLTMEDCTFKPSYNFQILLGSGTGTSLTGTFTFTGGDATVAGTSTLFTTELSVGNILKTNGGKFCRIASITNDTSLELDRQFEYTTETGVAATSYTGNLRNRFVRCNFEGSAHTDNFGMGLLVDSTIESCVSKNSGGGYGYGPDHCWYTTFRDCIGANNNNDGIGMETCAYSKVIGGYFYGSVNGNGIRLLSGSYRNQIIGATCRGNVNGINVTYNSTSFGKPNENSITDVNCELNRTHGLRIGGATRTKVNGGRFFNNDQNGIVTVTDSSTVPDGTSIVGVTCYDNQDTKTQERGIYILTGTNTFLKDNYSLDADHNIAGITDLGTDTITDVKFDIDTGSKNGVQRIRHSTENFLANASIEFWNSGTTVAPDAWTLAGDATISRVSNPTIGSYAAQIVFGTANTGEFYQAIDVSNLVDYTFSCYVERTSGSGTGRLVAQRGDSPFTEYASVAMPTGAGTQLVLLTVKPSVSGTMRFSIKSGNTTTSTWHVDECMLQESNAIATTFQHRMLDDTTNQNVYGDKYFGFISANNMEITTTLGIGNTATAFLDTPSSTTSMASLRIRSGTAPSSPNSGDIWFDGTNLKMRVGATTKTFTLT